MCVRVPACVRGRAQVYARVFNELDPNLSTLQMLTAVETKLEDLLALVLAMPPEDVEAAEKVRAVVACSALP
jgi:hypothetical protein